MNVHKNARLTPRSRAAMIHRILQLHEPVAEVAANFSISERCAYKWLARFRAEGLTGLHDRSSKPRCSPRTIHHLRRARIVALRRRRLPAFKIAWQAKLSKATVSRVLRRHGLQDLRRLEPPPPVVRYERSTPGELVHFDIKKLGRFARPGARMTGNPHDYTVGAGYEFVHVAIDDYSRIAFAQILPDEKTTSALAFLRAARDFFHSLGVKVQGLMSDNGGCYRSKRFAAVCKAWKLRHIFTRPYTPKTNGRSGGGDKRGCWAGEKPSASSRPLSASGPTPALTLPPASAPLISQLSSTTTTGTALTTPSISKPQSLASTST